MPQVAKMVDKDLARVGAQRLLPFEAVRGKGAFNGWGSHMGKVGFIVLYNVIYIYCSYIYIVILYI